MPTILTLLTGIHKPAPLTCLYNFPPQRWFWWNADQFAMSGGKAGMVKILGLLDAVPAGSHGIDALASAGVRMRPQVCQPDPG